MINQITELNQNEKLQLDLDGLLVFEDFSDSRQLDALRRCLNRLMVEQGERAGEEFKQEPETDRLANLVDKDDIFRRVIVEPKLLACVDYLLGSRYKLSSLNARSARPHSTWVQPLHCDMGAAPDAGGYSVCNIIWMLDDFTAENGATRYIPGSHRSGKLPHEVLADPVAPHPDEILITGRAGTVVVMNAHLWHGGTANRTGRPRLALHSFYCRWDLPQQQYQKKLLRPDVQQSLSSELRGLLALDDRLNDELSSRFSGRSGFLK